MPRPSPTLHLLCGKIAAGKSTLASKLAESNGTVLIAEDQWLNALFSDEMATASDYVQYASKLRKIMGPHVSSLLHAGASVVLDFQANTVESRAWMRGLFEAANASHRLHVLAPPDEVCLERLHKRNKQGDHPFAATEAQFRQFSKYFVAPSPDEGFNVVMHEEENWPA